MTELQRRYRLHGERLLPMLREVVERTGGIDAAEIDRIAAEVGLPRAHIAATASFYADFSPRSPAHATGHVRVCAGTACLAAGGRFGETAGALGATSDPSAEGGEVSVQPVHCLGYCYGGPAALAGRSPHAGADLVAQLTGESPPRDPEIPFSADTGQPVVLAGLLGDAPEPWAVWERALAGGGDRAGVAREVMSSGLRGRGGAGFPAAVKWGAAAESPSDGPRYLICNGDEGDPGAFVDRLLMERDPHGVLEGMALAALVAGATHGIAYVRSEYPIARDRIAEAIAEARTAGQLGEDVHGSGISFDIEVFEGAGSYVAGEETALIRSIEGLRGEVASRPPYPTERGLLHRPTVVNNVETLAAIRWIVAHGGAEYARLGAGESRGTKVVCLNERFRRPGAYEVEFGVGLRYIVDVLGGGLANDRELRALQVGGPLGAYLPADALDVPLGFETLQAVGADLGHGSLIAIDDGLDPAELLEHLWGFAADESCGTCAPCRIGTRHGLERVRAWRRTGEQPATLDEPTLDVLERGSLCAFGRSLPLAVRSLQATYPELAQ